jgi:uncharacterized protein (DUF2147 family)
MTGRLLVSLFALGIIPSAAAATPIFGRWVTQDNSAIVRIEPCGAKLCGRIERVLDPKAPKTDVNGKTDRGRSLVGTTVLSDFTGSGAKWTNGRAYDPKSGKDYRGELVLLTNDKLKVTGCVLIICQSMYWTRAQ